MSLPSGEKSTPAPSRSSPFGQGIVLRDLLRRQVVLHERRRADLPAVGLQRGFLDDQDQVFVVRVRLQAPDARPLVALGQREGVERLACDPVDDLDLLECVVERVEARSIVRHDEPGGHPDLERDLADDLLGGFVEHRDRPFVGADVDRVRPGSVLARRDWRAR